MGTFTISFCPRPLRSSSVSNRAAQWGVTMCFISRRPLQGFRFHSDKGYTPINAPKWFTLCLCARAFVSLKSLLVDRGSIFSVLVAEQFLFFQWRSSYVATDSSEDLSPSSGRLLHVLPPKCNIPKSALSLILASQVSYFQPSESSPAWVALWDCIEAPFWPFAPKRMNF